MSSYPGQTHFRWPGMPTSGRYVYKVRYTDDWYWQCDVCGAPRFEDAKTYPDMLTSFQEAWLHAADYCAGYWEGDES